MFSASKTGAGASGYPIVNSLRFQSASSQYLSRTPGTTTNRKTWSQSFWTKYSATADGSLVGIVQNSSQTQYRVFFENRNLRIFSFESGFQFQFITTQVFRDPSAWYHILIVLDTTQATSTNRFKLYVNGVQVTAFSTASYPSLNADCNWNRNLLSQIGASGNTDSFYDGYITEVNFVDGQALTPSSFGTTDTTTGQWIAKSYSGSYGTNGFFLKFANGTSTTTLGSDSSGNGNNWTLNNFTRSAGVSDCWMNDVPSGNGSSVGGTQPNSNYAVMNPLGKSSTATVTNGNLTLTNSTLNTYPAVSSSIFVSTGKWYFETTYTGSGTAEVAIGLSIYQTLVSRQFQGTGAGTAPNTTLWNSAQGIFKDGTLLSATPTFTFNDVIGVAYDADAGTVTYYKNGVAQTPVVTGITGSYAPTLGINYYNNGTLQFNAGQRSFAYTPPSGFKALCTANLPTATIKKGSDQFNTVLYTGDGTNFTTLVSTGFAFGFSWIKNRSVAVSHNLYDVVRNASLESNTTGAEFGPLIIPSGTGFLPSSDSRVNQSGQAFVQWAWKDGSSTVTNTSGTISSQVRANPTAGVSVVTLTTQASGVGTYGHGLGVAPKMIIHKFRSVVGDWSTYHESLGNTKYIFLNTGGAAVTNSIWWNNTSPTSSVVTLGSAFAGSSAIVAYCFAEISGFSKIGSYTGNGSADGPFVYCGFRPKYVMIKNSTSGAGYDWEVYDSVRGSYNLDNQVLYPDLTQVEATPAAAGLDLLSNGFKIRFANGNNNPNGATMIYMAFAENPFAQANAR